MIKSFLKWIFWYAKDVPIGSKVGYNHQIGTRQGDQMIIVEWDKLHYLNEMVAKLTKMEYTHENG